MEFSGTLQVGGRELTLRSGRLARQADGAVEVLYGDTVVLTTACVDEPDKDLPFFPLTVEYQEMAYSAGKIPGGFFKREGKPSNLETVSARLIDRPIRPMFPDGYQQEVQIVSTVFSAESENLPDVMSIVGASAALMIADTPFQGPLGAVRVGLGDRRGEFVINPSHSKVEEGKLDLIVAGTRDAITMVEASAREVPESILLDAMDRAREEIKEIVELQDALVQQCQKPQTEFIPPRRDDEMVEQVKEAGRDRVEEALFIPDKQERETALDEVEEQLREELLGDLEDEDDDRRDLLEETFEWAFEKLQKEIARTAVLEEERRIDGRSLDEIRPINVEVGQLPRTHGSGLFTRGETQSLATVTLGTPSETQRVDTIHQDSEKKFMLHYNFPPYSVGEVRPMRGPGRREIGHGLLAESALRAVFPEEDEAWPYTTRVVSEILESNGSSSMASVCAGSMALMDAGVPLERPVSGVAMGLFKDGEEARILTDILGDEDHMGDMDFKVAGTEKGVTALQMDIKIGGLDRSILEDALKRAREARMEILDAMNEAIEEPRSSISKYAPRLYTLEIPQDKIRDLIGPGGKNIRKIIDETGASIDVEDDGTVFIGAEDEAAGEAARERVKQYTQEVQVGETYEGTVVSTTDFGAFVEVLPGQEGLVHISELADRHVKETTDVVQEGDRVTVKCTDITEKGIELSKVAADKEKAASTAKSGSGNSQ